MHSNVARYIHIMEKIDVQMMAWYTGWGQGVWGGVHRPQPPNATPEGAGLRPATGGGRQHSPSPDPSPVGNGNL